MWARLADDSERVYTIPLGKVLLSPDNRRAMRAINMIREFARRHMKVQEIKIDQSLSHEIWARGIKSPPRKVRVRMSKTEEGHVLVSPYSLGAGPDDGAGGKDDAAKDESPAVEDAPGDDVAPEAETADAPETDTADAADVAVEPKGDDAKPADAADVPAGPKGDDAKPADAPAAKPKPADAPVTKPKAAGGSAKPDVAKKAKSSAPATKKKSK